MPSLIEEFSCPFCGADNRCMINSDEECWCVPRQIPQALLDLLPPTQRRKVCICSACIESFKRDAGDFEVRLRSQP